MPKCGPAGAGAHALKARLLGAANECVYCGVRTLGVDHFYPVVGQDGLPTGFCEDIWNSVACCPTCNSSKGNRPWLQFMQSTTPRSPRGRGCTDWPQRIARLKKFAAAGHQRAQRWNKDTLARVLHALRAALTESTRRHAAVVHELSALAVRVQPPPGKLAAQQFRKRVAHVHVVRTRPPSGALGVSTQLRSQQELRSSPRLRTRVAASPRPPPRKKRVAVVLRPPPGKLFASMREVATVHPASQCMLVAGADGLCRSICLRTCAEYAVHDAGRSVRLTLPTQRKYAKVLLRTQAARGSIDVVRSAKLRSAHAPERGYLYGGAYIITSHCKHAHTLTFTLTRQK